MCESHPCMPLVSWSRLLLCRLFVVLCVWLLLPVSCKGTRHEARTGSCPVSTIMLMRADNGKTIEICVDDTLVIRLDENPTTGYQWAMEEPNEEVVALQSADYLRSRSAGVGGGGQRVWTLTAKKTGVVILRLKLWRAWEGETSIVERFTVTLHVHEEREGHILKKP